MCGIAGELRFGGGVVAAPLQAMARGLRHRGPDDEGLWLEARRRCGFSFRRLSIIDLSPLAHQPMVDPETGNVIVFNGEIYNFRELRRECEEAGAKFRSQGDAEVLLVLYRRFGPDCVRRLRGMFALAIWDARNSELFLARDRFGKKPLNYALTQGGLVFCSEIDPLARHPAVSRKEDAEALELYLQLLYVPAPWTIYKHIRKLSPAHWALCSSSGFRTRQYWDIDYTRQIRVTDEEALEGFEEKFTEAVRLRMIADVPLGALLSGGVDSSAVVAAMAKHSFAPVKTFSVGFEEEGLNELPYAGQAARICGTEHHPQVVTADVDALLPIMARHYGEPYADPSAIPSFVVSRTAREHVTVALNGDGGDELLGGYPRYRLSRASLAASYLLGPLVPVQSLVSLAADHLIRPAFLSRMMSRAMREVLHPELGSLINSRNNWDAGGRAALLQDGHAGRVVPAWRAEWLSQAHMHASNPFDRMLYFDNHTQLPGDLLVKMDIASMHCGLEARSPLLDHELAEFCAALPLRMKLRNRCGKYLLKRLAAKTFGWEFVSRPKQGFGIPLGQWLKGTLRNRMIATLSDSRLMEPFDAAVVANTLWGFLVGSRPDHAYRLWGLLVYGTWRQAAQGSDAIDSGAQLQSAH